MEYVSPEVRRLRAERAYHVQCIAQYRDTVARISMRPAQKLRVLENIKFHEQKLVHVDATLKRLEA